MSSTIHYRATPDNIPENTVENAMRCDEQGRALINPAPLDPTNDAITVYPKCSYTNTADSVLVKTGAGQAYGVIINSHSSGTLKLWDNTAASGTVLCNTITFAAGERFIPLLGATFGTGLYATIGGTADVTILFR